MSPPLLKYDIVDVFTTEKYLGNPLAVVHVSASSRGDITLQDKQKIAREFNLSETVFLHDAGSQEDNKASVTRDVDIFMPEEQIPLAGHPVVGTAWLVGSANPALEKAVFNVTAGAVHIDLARREDVLQASALMPHNVHLHKQFLPQEELQSLEPALKHLRPGQKQGWPVVSLTKGVTFALIEVDSFETLGKVSTFSRPAGVDLDDGWSPSLLGLYFYFRRCQGGSPGVQKLHSRMMEPGIGEDPVTGAASCVVSAYLAVDAFKRDGAREMEFHITQGEHCGRPGSPTVRVSIHENGDVDRIILGGTAVRVMSGVIS